LGFVGLSVVFSSRQQKKNIQNEILQATSMLEENTKPSTDNTIIIIIRSVPSQSGPKKGRTVSLQSHATGRLSTRH
jgi:hypothetical protein